MSAWQVILSVLGLLVLLPVLSYMVVKFGVAGYLRAKERQKQKEQKDEKVRKT